MNPKPVEKSTNNNETEILGGLPVRTDLRAGMDPFFCGDEDSTAGWSVSATGDGSFDVSVS